MNLRPLGDRVIVQAVEKEDRTKSGLIMPDTAKEKPLEGIVKAVGPGKLDDNGKRLAMEVKVGDTVIYSKYSGTEVKIDGEEYLILRETDVQAIVEK
jgi:chaperonin GroES